MNELKCMKTFFETRFGPHQLAVLDEALEIWRSGTSLTKKDPDLGIAAEVCVNLFREGYATVPDLFRAMSGHKALQELASWYRVKGVCMAEE